MFEYYLKIWLHYAAGRRIPEIFRSTSLYAWYVFLVDTTKETRIRWRGADPNTIAGSTHNNSD